MTNTEAHTTACIERNLGRVQDEVLAQGLEIVWGETDAENSVPAWGRSFESLRVQWMTEGTLSCDCD